MDLDESIAKRDSVDHLIVKNHSSHPDNIPSGGCHDDISHAKYSFVKIGMSKSHVAGVDGLCLSVVEVLSNEVVVALGAKAEFGKDGNAKALRINL